MYSCIREYIVKRGNTIIGTETRKYSKNKNIWNNELYSEFLQTYVLKYSILQLDTLQLIDVNEKINATYYDKCVKYDKDTREYINKVGEKKFSNDNIYLKTELYDFLPFLFRNVEIGVNKWYCVLDNAMERLVYYTIRKISENSYAVLAPDLTIVQYDIQGLLEYSESIVTGTKVIRVK